MIITIITY